VATNGHRPDCDGCVPCQEPECQDVAYCVNERPTGNLCEHHVDAVCPEHWPGECRQCRAEAEREMFESGVYRPRSDPLNFGVDVDPLDVAEWLNDLTRRAEESGYDPVTNTHHYPRPGGGA
jgi:hypothetical protein